MTDSTPTTAAGREPMAGRDHDIDGFAWPEDCVLVIPPHTVADPVPWGGRSACRTCAAAAEDLHRSLDEIAEAERRAWETSRDIFIC